MRLTALIAALALAGLPAASWGADDPPAIVTLALDISGSVEADWLGETRVLADSILQGLSEGTEVAVLVFDEEPRLLLERTSDPEAVRQALAGVQRGGRDTALYDAIHEASQYLQAAPLSRKAIILVTDGKDEKSTLDLDASLEIATAERIPVFAVGVGRIEEADLGRIAKLTGGEFAVARRANGPGIAARITALKPSGTPSPASSRAAASTRPESSSPPRGTRTAVLLLLAGLAVLALGAILVTLAIRRPRAPKGPRPGAQSPEDPPTDLHAETEVMRTPALGDKGETVLLRARPALRVTAGPGVGRVLVLGLGRAVTIGRGAANDLQVDDASVSAEHCRVKPEGADFVIYDVQSTNGTLVNGEPVVRQRLRDGDVISLGAVTMTFGRG